LDVIYPVMGSRYINILFFSLIFINAGFAQAVKLATSATIIEHNRFVVTSENNVTFYRHEY